MTKQSHPNAIDMLEYVVFTEKPYFDIEYLESKTLNKDGGYFSYLNALKILLPTIFRYEFIFKKISRLGRTVNLYKLQATHTSYIK